MNSSSIDSVPLRIVSPHSPMERNGCDDDVEEYDVEVVGGGGDDTSSEVVVDSIVPAAAVISTATVVNGGHTNHHHHHPHHQHHHHHHFTIDPVTNGDLGESVLMVESSDSDSDTVIDRPNGHMTEEEDDDKEEELVSTEPDTSTPLTNGPTTAANNIHFFYEDDNDSGTDLSGSAGSENELESTTTTTPSLYACDDLATLRRSPKDSSHKSSNPTTTLTTFSVSYPTQVNDNDYDHNNSTTTTPSYNGTSLVNGSAGINYNIKTESSELDEDVIFPMDEECGLSAAEMGKSTLRNGSYSSLVSTYFKANNNTNNINNNQSTSPSSDLSGSDQSESSNPQFDPHSGQYVSCTNPFYPDLASTSPISSKIKLQSATAPNTSSMIVHDSSSSSATSAPSTLTQDANNPNSMQPHCPLEVPYAIMTNKENSCPFFERRIALMVPVKVGRAIARVRPAPDNAIFDCKVLSRNHALLWYQDGKFFLRDTCSSNGTFINNARLSTANEKSQPHELFSGDCVQFGVEVTEKKQVHSCVIATIRIFLPDGTEARPASIASDYGLLDEYHHQKGSLYGPNSYLSPSLNITPSQLIELSHFIKDALHKQCLLESQLDSMRHVMDAAMESAKNGWKSLVEEDRLLSRIESLQAKVETLLVAVATSKDITVDIKVETLREEMLNIISDKEKFEISTKCSLAKAMEDKMTAMANLHSAELELQTKDEECHRLSTQVNQNMKEMQSLTNNCEKARKDVEELVAKLRQTEEEQNKVSAKFEKERGELQEKIGFLEQTTADYRLRLHTSTKKPEDEGGNQTHAESESVITQPNQTEQNESSSADDTANHTTALSSTTQLHHHHPNGTTTTSSSLDSSHMVDGIDRSSHKDSQATLLRQYESEISKFRQWLADTSTQYRKFYTATMSKLVSIDSLLAEKESIIVGLTERVQTLGALLVADKQRHAEQNAEMNMLLESESEDNLRLSQKLRHFESIYEQQNEELEKFKCDIDVLRNGQVREQEEKQKEKQKAKITRLDSTTQTTFELMPLTPPSSPPSSTMNDTFDTNNQTDQSNNTTSTTTDSTTASISEQPSPRSRPPVLGPKPDLSSLKEQLKCAIESANQILLLQCEELSSELSSQTVDAENICQSITTKMNQLVECGQQLENTNAQLKAELDKVNENYQSLSNRNDLSFAMAMCPLLIIFMAIIFAFYPILSFIMGTSGL